MYSYRNYHVFVGAPTESLRDLWLLELHIFGLPEILQSLNPLFLTFYIYFLPFRGNCSKISRGGIW